jgi:RNA polymerase sigma factor (sigma-70 family)
MNHAGENRCIYESAVSTFDTSLGGGQRQFPSTSWTLIRQVRAGGDLSWREPFERLVQLYWKPAYHYIRVAGRRGVEEAKDLAQDFFARMMERRDWERLDPALGSFRAFLKRALKNFLVDASRREEARRPQPGAFTFALDEQRDRLPVADADPDRLFDREWARTVIHASIQELEGRLRDRGMEKQFEVFRMYCLPGQEGPKLNYAELGERLGLTENEVGKRLVRCRAELREIMVERIRQYVGDEVDVENELLQILAE